MVNSIAYLKSLYSDTDYTVPRIHVTNKTKVNRTENGVAGTVAVIGAFPNAETELKAFDNYEQMLDYYAIVEGSVQEKAFDGLLACKQLLRTRNHLYQNGAASVICVNITTYSDKVEFTESAVKVNNKEIKVDGDKVYQELSSYKLKNPYSTNNYTENPLDPNIDFDETYYSMNLTYEKYDNALSRLYGEQFDQLFIADTMKNVMLQTRTVTKRSETAGTGGKYSYETSKKAYGITKPHEMVLGFLNHEFQLQRPSQYYAPLVCLSKTEQQNVQLDDYEIGSITTGTVQGTTEEQDEGETQTQTPTSTSTNTSTTSYDPNEYAYIDSIQVNELYDLLKEDVFGCGGLFSQRIYIDNQVEPLSLIESAAYIVGYLASLKVQEPLTFKSIPGVTGVADTFYVGPSDTGYQLAKKGFPVIVNKVRHSTTGTGQYCVLNSILPCGFDVAHIRSVSYLIRQYDLQQYLGFPNSDVVRAQIGADMSIVNQRVLGECNIIDSIDSSNIFVPERNGVPCPHEVYIELIVTVHGVIIVINLGVDMQENTLAAAIVEGEE